jgi:CheY-like chemotaxis protein
MPSDVETKRILLLDDDETWRFFMADYFERAGLLVDSAGTPEEAIDLSKRNSPALIVMDVVDSGMGGLGFLKRLKASPGKLRFPVIVYTDRSSMEPFCREVGVLDVVSKSTPGGTLLDRVFEVLGLVPGKTGPRRKRRLALLAEDDEAFAAVVVSALRAADYDVVRATSGPEAIKAAKREQPEVMIVKQVFPGLNGSEVVNFLRTDPATRTLPLVLHDSTRGANEKPRYLYNLPADVKALVGPSDTSALLEAVELVQAK